MLPYSNELDRVLREAVADNMRPSDVKRKLRAGTFPGCDHRWPDLAESTFWQRWKRAKAQPGGHVGRESILDVIARSLEEQEAQVAPIREQAESMLADGASPEQVIEQIAGSTELSAYRVNELLPDEHRLNPRAIHAEHKAAAQGPLRTDARGSLSP